MADLGSSRIFGKLTVIHDAEVKGVITGDGSGLTNLNASNLSSGTVSYARLPISSSQVSNWDTAHSWGNHALAGYAADSSISTVGKTGSWNDLLNKPSTFTPSSHTHAASDIVSGTLSTARIPTITHTMVNFADQDLNRSNGVSFVNQTLSGSGEVLSIDGSSSSLDGADAWIRIGNPSYAWKLNYRGSTGGTGGNEFEILSTNTGNGFRLDHVGNFQLIGSTISGNGSGLTNIGYGSTTFADQNLNTGDSPTFSQINLTSDIKSTKTRLSFLNGSNALPINTNELLVSNSYTDSSLVPANGAYVKGNLDIGGIFNGDGSGLTGAASLRATETTKADVGLSNIPNLSVTDSATGNTIMQRNSSGDTWARLFRSNYSSTNSDIAAIYTTKTIGGDYMRPSTPAQVKSALNITAGDVGAVPTGRNIATGTGLSGGGNLTANRTFSLQEIYAGSSSQGALWYHGTTRTAAMLYGGGTNPSSSNRLNYDGYLWATRFYTASSIRYKNIDYTETLQTSLNKVVSIGSKGVKVGHYKESETKETIRWFIAEEINEVTPEAVTKDDQGRPDGIDSDQLIPDLYAAVAELSNSCALIPDLHKVITDLINRVKELEEN